MDTISIIKESFEEWYNSHYGGGSVSALINYNDTQEYSMKAIHTACIEVSIVGIEGGSAVVTPILKLSENYNHGITSEQEARDMMAKKLLVGLFDSMGS